MKISKKLKLILETITEQQHWFGPPMPGPGYNPPVDNNTGQIIPGDYICLDGQCEDCSQGQPVSYECYNPQSPPLYPNIQACQQTCGQVPGCTDPNATNYNSNATVDDNSCILPAPHVVGCMDPTALNYTPNATQDSGNCIYGCVEYDFKYNSYCGYTYLGPAPGKANTWNNWLNNQWNAFNGQHGCYQLGSIITYTNQQLQPTINCPAIYQHQGGSYGGEKLNGTCLNLIQIKRKIAKLMWAHCMKNKCDGGPQNGC